jgi:GMP synthase-like glutamine amidotransferase
MVDGPRRFAVIDCEDLPHWNGHARFWLAPLARPGETWDVFRAWAGELPAEPADYDAVVITGSHHSVNDPEQGWLEPLFELVRRATGEPGGPRVLGACFGLQVAARALGGRVEPNPVGRFVFGTERVSIDPAFHAAFTGAGAGARGPSEATLFSSHGEQATLLPPGARALGRSATAEHEIFAIEDRLLAVQFHAELTREAFLELILPRLRANGRLAPEHEAIALAAIDATVDSAAFLQIFRRWLDRPRSW